MPPPLVGCGTAVLSGRVDSMVGVNGEAAGGGMRAGRPWARR